MERFIYEVKNLEAAWSNLIGNINECLKYNN